MQVSQKFNILNDLELRIPVSIFFVTCISSSQKLDEIVIIVWQAIHVYVDFRVFFMSEVYLKSVYDRTSSGKSSISVLVCKISKIVKCVSCVSFCWLDWKNLCYVSERSNFLSLLFNIFHISSTLWHCILFSVKCVCVVTSELLLLTRRKLVENSANRKYTL